MPATIRWVFWHAEHQSPGDGSTVRKRTVTKPVKINEQSPPCKSTSLKVQARMLQNFDRARAISHIQSENDQQLQEAQETLWHSNQIPFFNSAGFVHQSDTYGLSESSTGFVKIMSHDSDTALTSKMCSGTESEKSLLEGDFNTADLKTSAQKTQFICIECGESFSEIAKLLQHETKHVGESYYCALCGKSFGERRGFLRHQRVHLGDKPFPCSICEATFKEKGALLRHHKIHTGEKPFQCLLCGRSYNRKDTLVRHELTIHKKDQTVFDSLM